MGKNLNFKKEKNFKKLAEVLDPNDLMQYDWYDREGGKNSFKYVNSGFGKGRVFDFFNRTIEEMSYSYQYSKKHIYRLEKTSDDKVKLYRLLFVVSEDEKSLILDEELVFVLNNVLEVFDKEKKVDNYNINPLLVENFEGFKEFEPLYHNIILKLGYSQKTITSLKERDILTRRKILINMAKYLNNNINLESFLNLEDHAFNKFFMNICSDVIDLGNHRYNATKEGILKPLTKNIGIQEHMSVVGIKNVKLYNMFIYLNAEADVRSKLSDIKNKKLLEFIEMNNYNLVRVAELIENFEIEDLNNEKYEIPELINYLSNIETDLSYYSRINFSDVIWLVDRLEYENTEVTLDNIIKRLFNDTFRQVEHYKTLNEIFEGKESYLETLKNIDLDKLGVVIG